MAKMDRPFDEELKLLKEKLLDMASRAEESIARPSAASRTGRRTHRGITREPAISILDIGVDRCAAPLALPAGSTDSASSPRAKIGTDLERIGDLAVNIAERTFDLLKQPQLKPLIDIPRMADLAQGMVHEALDAYVRGDETLAREVCERDDQVDQLNNQIFRELLTYMIEDPTTITRAVDLILVGRHLERIADHATNIGEDALYGQSRPSSTITNGPEEEFVSAWKKA
jgi:phosphate transport system protein